MADDGLNSADTSAGWRYATPAVLLHWLLAWTVPDHDTAELFFGLHSTLAWVLVALVALHAAGGLKHLLVDKDGVFQRMWF